jgi:hypothetical protein
MSKQLHYNCCYSIKFQPIDTVTMSWIHSNATYNICCSDMHFISILFTLGHLWQLSIIFTFGQLYYFWNNTFNVTILITYSKNGRKYWENFNWVDKFMVLHFMVTSALRAVGRTRVLPMTWHAWWQVVWNEGKQLTCRPLHSIMFRHGSLFMICQQLSAPWAICSQLIVS